MDLHVVRKISGTFCWPLRCLLCSAALIFGLLSGCSDTGTDIAESPAPISAESEKTPVVGINWHDGSVDSAFSLARTSGKPLFLYWGAVWCPPCQEIKHTVFKSPEFIAQTRLFIPVYLDGDTDRAQTTGEQFGVKGYPTMIVFSPEGDEITRIPGGIDISQYNSVLATSLDTMRPTSMLVQLALESPESLLESDFLQLAYYSWGQDFNAVPDDVDTAALFGTLADLSNAVHPEASARFYMEHLVALSAAQAAADESDSATLQSVDSPSGSKDEPATTGPNEAFERILGILDNPELTLACWEAFVFYSNEVLLLDVFSEEEKAELGTVWAEAVFSLRNHPSLSTAEQLGGWLPRLLIHFEDESSGPIPEDWARQIRQELQLADSKTKNAYARQSVINRISYIYQNAKLIDDARALLLAELEKSASPYYFMSGLAAIAEDNGNIEEAIEWNRKAFESSQGAATRFQWGGSYVRSLIRLTPENADRILTASIGLLDELQGEQTVFAGRNFNVVRRLHTALTDWQQATGSDPQSFEDNIRQLCESQEPGSSASVNCQSLLNTT